MSNRTDPIAVAPMPSRMSEELATNRRCASSRSKERDGELPPTAVGARARSCPAPTHRRTNRHSVSVVVGRACLLLALLASLWAVGAGIVGRRSGRDELVESARRGIYAVLAMAVIAMAILEAAYVRSDFR